MDNRYFEFEDTALEDFDSAKAGDEVAYEDEQQEMFEHYRFDISAGQVPMRVDKYLATHMEYTSRHRIQLAIKAEYIRVNDKIVKANYVVRPGDVIKFVMPYQRRGLEILPEAIPLNIVYEDDDVLVLNKEAGMVVHPGHGHFSGTLVNALAHHLGISQDADAKDERMGVLVHRIDKDTSGLLVVAKNDEAQLDLAKQFFVHSSVVMWRSYGAISRRTKVPSSETSDATLTTECASGSSLTAITASMQLRTTRFLSVSDMSQLWNVVSRPDERIRSACISTGSVIRSSTMRDMTAQRSVREQSMRNTVSS